MRNGMAMVGLLAFVACSAGTEAQDGGSRLHREARGFEVRLPDGWTVRPDHETARVEIIAAAGGRLVVWPLFVERSGAVSDAAILRHLAGRLWPGAEWMADVASRDTGMLKGAQDGDRVAAAVATSRSAAGTAVVLYAVQAPVGRFSRVAEDAVPIFASVRFTGPDSTPASRRPALHFVRWNDPREGAFTVEVPAGWQVQGGTFRAAPVDVRPAVEVRSPDGEVIVRLGDADMPTFVEPMGVFPEGSTYNPYGSPMQVRRLTSGRDFAAGYARSRLAQACGQVEILRAGDRADAVQSINAIYRRFGLLAQLTAGDVSFRCRGGIVGYYFAGVQVIRMGGPAMWKAEYLLGYLAPASRAREADQVMSRLMGSFAIDPQWMAMQQGVAQGSSEIVQQAGDAIARMTSDSYWAKQAAESELSRRRSNSMLGVEDVTDEHGNTYRVESGSSHYWITPRGTIVGTNVDAVPGVDFKRLTVY